jgi:hypothetical protein
MAKLHDYTAQIIWTGDRGEGTRHYRGYMTAHGASPHRASP